MIRVRYKSFMLFNFFCKLWFLKHTESPGSLWSSETIIQKKVGDFCNKFWRLSERASVGKDLSVGPAIDILMWCHGWCVAVLTDLWYPIVPVDSTPVAKPREILCPILCKNCCLVWSKIGKFWEFLYDVLHPSLSTRSCWLFQQICGQHHKFVARARKVGQEDDWQLGFGKPALKSSTNWELKPWETQSHIQGVTY